MPTPSLRAAELDGLRALPAWGQVGVAARSARRARAAFLRRLPDALTDWLGAVDRAAGLAERAAAVGRVDADAAARAADAADQVARAVATTPLAAAIAASAAAAADAARSAQFAPGGGGVVADYTLHAARALLAAARAGVRPRLLLRDLDVFAGGRPAPPLPPLPAFAPVPGGTPQFAVSVAGAAEDDLHATLDMLAAAYRSLGGAGLVPHDQPAAGGSAHPALHLADITADDARLAAAVGPIVEWLHTARLAADRPPGPAASVGQAGVRFLVYERERAAAMCPPTAPADDTVPGPSLAGDTEPELPVLPAPAVDARAEERAAAGRLCDRLADRLLRRGVRVAVERGEAGPVRLTVVRG